MKLRIKKSILENIVSNMQPFLEKKDQSSITSHLYFEMNDLKLEVRATDYEMGLKMFYHNPSPTCTCGVISTLEHECKTDGLHFRFKA